MAEKTIDFMKQELEDAGYRLELEDGTARAHFDGWTCERRFTDSEPDYFIPMIYAHLQRERRYAAMEALLTYFANAELPFPRSMSDGYQAFYKWQARVKALLGKDGGE